MKTSKIFLLGFLFLFFILFDNQAFAGTGGANDGQVMLLAILAVLLVILGILYFFPFLVHLIRDFWNKYHHC
jgi:type III secretory pathway component EscU